MADGLARELEREYERRFREMADYRNEVWKILTRDYFQRDIDPAGAVLDLGCGWGEFINNIRAGRKYAMDLNAGAPEHLHPDVHFIHHDCAQPWPLEENSLDCVFTSNFFEHLPSKNDLKNTLLQVRRALKPGGQLICMGPNIRYLTGQYWDFWDHFVPLTERSLKEALEIYGFSVSRCLDKFLPFTMVGKRRSPMILVRWYLHLPIAWRLFGKQFLVYAIKDPEVPVSAGRS